MYEFKSSEGSISGSDEEELSSQQSEAGGNASESNDEKPFQIVSSAVTSVDSAESVPLQLNLWDQLMTARIKMQQVMKTSNSLSMQKTVQQSSDVRKNARVSVKRIEQMQQHLQSLKQSLLNGLDEKLDCSDFSLDSNGALWESVLDEWWKKTCTPDLSKKGGHKGNFSQLEESPVKYAKRLMADKQSLLRRTHLKRLDYGINPAAIGSSKAETTSEEHHDPSIFDDNDFYQVLIRDVISKKLSASNDPSAMARTILSGEKLTSDIIKPKKQDVDRRASKGRKLRYTVMPKLVNYMGPDNKIVWTDQQCDELFKSLFQQI